MSFTARTVISGLAQDSQAQGVTGPTGVYWYDPRSLAQMSQAQVLDQDPITGEQLSVAFVGPGSRGSAVVVIDSRLPGVTVRSTYEQASGMLVGYETNQASTGITISLQLVDRR